MSRVTLRSEDTEFYGIMTKWVIDDSENDIDKEFKNMGETLGLSPVVLSLAYNFTAIMSYTEERLDVLTSGKMFNFTIENDDGSIIRLGGFIDKCAANIEQGFITLDISSCGTVTCTPSAEKQSLEIEVKGGCTFNKEGLEKLMKLINGMIK